MLLKKKKLSPKNSPPMKRPAAQTSKSTTPTQKTPDIAAAKDPDSDREIMVSAKSSGEKPKVEKGAATSTKNKSLRAVFAMDDESSPSAKSNNAKCVKCSRKAIFASMDDDDAKPVFCDIHGRNLGQKVFRVTTGPIDK
jgi:hypothetical protein